MRKEKSVNLLFFKFGDDLLKTLIIVKKTLIINVCDIYEINAKLLKSLSSKSAIFYCIRCAENTSSGWCVTNFDLVHF